MNSIVVTNVTLSKHWCLFVASKGKQHNFLEYHELNGILPSNLSSPWRWDFLWYILLPGKYGENITETQFFFSKISIGGEIISNQVLCGKVWTLLQRQGRYIYRNHFSFLPRCTKNPHKLFVIYRREENRFLYRVPIGTPRPLELMRSTTTEVNNFCLFIKLNHE